jgi:hypothetical protein
MYAKQFEGGDLESKAKWIKSYKFFCGIIALVSLICLIIVIVKVISDISAYLYITIAALVIQIILFGGEYIAIHNSNASLHFKIFAVSGMNFLALTIWEFVGSFVLETTALAIPAGIASLIISGGFFFCNWRVKKNFEGTA